MGGRGAGGSRSKNLLEGPTKANASSGAQSEALDEGREVGAPPAAGTGKPGQSAHTIVSELIAQLIPQTFFCCNFPVQNYRIYSRTNFCYNFPFSSRTDL